MNHIAEDGRNVLSQNEEISLLRATDCNMNGTRTFIIDEVKSTKGASVVSYIAHPKDGLGFKGVLKEFYPISDRERYKDNYLPYLIRINNQLVYDDDFPEKKEAYESYRNKYVDSFRRLASVKETDKEQLQKFLPAFEIYKSNGGDTIYIWTQNPPLETFEEVCARIHMTPFLASEKKLCLILNSIRLLAIHINSLHISGFIHRDIKPANFGFLVDENKQTLDQTLSLFDVDSICRMDNREELRKPVGTPGFMSPEAKKIATIRTDVYSIGATLFYALVNTATTKNKPYAYCYEDDYYDRIRDFVDHSDLIRISDYNQNPKLKKILANILERCLYVGDKMSTAYESCEKLISDINAALDFIPPSEKEFFNRRWVLAEIDNEERLLRERSIRTAALHLLYKYPLYKGIKHSENLQPVRVLIIGFPYYSQIFLDACLQTLQMPGCYPKVTVLYNDEDNKKNYKEDRKELFNFFDEGDILSDDENYGTIQFVKCDSLSNETEELAKYCSISDCIFIDIGSGNTNENLKLAKYAKQINAATMIYYTDDSTSIGEEEKVPDVITFNPNGWRPDEELERMALNVHSVWNNKQVSYKSIEEEFHDTYNYNSCISNVLSIKYKLHGVGIDMDSTSNEDAANKFQKSISGDDGKRLTNELMYYEHRRWAAEKICEGWQKKPTESCFDGITNDKENKKHVCIVKGKKNQYLFEHAQENLDVWENQKDLSQFDDLDAMSIRLHRNFVKWSLKSKNSDTNRMSIKLIDSIISSLGHNDDVMKSFQEWKTCMIDIRENGKQRAGSYDGLRERFLSQVRKAMELSEDERYSEIEESVKQLDRFYRPILLSQKYIDYKRYDIELIKSIPFILLNRRTEGIIVPVDPDYSKNDNGIFDYVASAMVLKPSRIVYVSYVSNSKNYPMLCETMSVIFKYLIRSNLSAKIDWFVAGGNSDKRIDMPELPKDCNLVFVESQKDIVTRLTHLLSEIHDCLLEVNQTQTSKFLCSITDLVIKKKYCVDTKDDGKAFFYNIENADYLKYVEVREYPNVADIIKLGRGESNSYFPPEFYNEYENLWRWYKDNGVIWKNTCQILGSYHDRVDEIMVIPLGANSKKSKRYEFLMPAACTKAVEKIMNYLEKKGVIREGRIEGWQSDTIKVSLLDWRQKKRRDDWNRVFYPSYRLLSEDLIYCYVSKHRLHIMYHNLVLGNDFKLKEEVKHYNHNRNQNVCISATGFREYIKEVNNLRLFEKKGEEEYYYTSLHAKKILTSAGKLLEVYLYHELKASGKYDDIVCGYEITNSDNTMNEIDIILIKGLTTVFIECKARNDLEEDSYEKLVSIKKRYGINSKAVMVSDLGVEQLSQRQLRIVEKMEKMGITTIWERGKIESICQSMDVILSN